MKTICSLLMLALLITSAAVFAVAREGPNKRVAVIQGTHQAIAPAPVVVESVPPMTVGYDVICNITNVANAVAADTSAELELSTTVAWRTLRGRTLSGRTLSAPHVVLLA